MGGPFDAVHTSREAEQDDHRRNDLTPDDGHEGAIEATAVAHQQDAEHDPNGYTG